MFRKGRRDDMLKIAGYRLDGELQPAANGYVGSGTRVSDGKRVFLKQFDRYVAPSERALASGASSALERQREFEAYRRHLVRLDARLLAACGSSPNPCLVRPVEVVRWSTRAVLSRRSTSTDATPARPCWRCSRTCCAPWTPFIGRVSCS